MLPYHKVMQALSRRRGDAVVVPTMTAARTWPEFSTNETLDLPLSGCMGKASSLGLGIAIARPERRVIVIDGDGSLLMNLGTLVTIANAAPANLIHCVFENGVYEITGSQPVPGEGRFNFATMASGAGFPNAFDVHDEAELDRVLDAAFSKPGPTFVAFHVTEVGEELPSPKRNTRNAWREVQEALAAG